MLLLLQCMAGEKGIDRKAYGPYIYALEPDILATLTMHGEAYVPLFVNADCNCLVPMGLPVPLWLPGRSTLPQHLHRQADNDF